MAEGGGVRMRGVRLHDTLSEFTTVCTPRLGRLAGTVSDSADLGGLLDLASLFPILQTRCKDSR